MWIMCISFQDYVDPAEVLVLVEVAPRKGWIKIAYQLPSLKLTAKAPENGWLEYDRFLLEWPIFRGELLVSGRVDIFMYIE